VRAPYGDAVPERAPVYPLLTERLLLRPMGLGVDIERDIDAVHAYQSLPEVCRYVPYPPRTRDEVAERLTDPERTRSSFTEPGQVIDLAIVRQADERVIGDLVVFWTSAEHRSGEVGYALHPDFHGRGYASEAATAGLAIAFDVLGLHRVVGRIDARNTASAAVLRRIGMRHEATLVDNEWFKDQWSTEQVFAMLDHEWQARQAPAGR
jgi:RimJ/RimL family protein N-acetyltransferase